MGLAEFFSDLAARKLSKHQKVDSKASGISQDRARKLRKRFDKAGKRGPRGY